MFSEEIEPLIFYILIVYGFNNQIRFNNKGEFNTPAGKRDFDQKMSDKLKKFMNLFQKRKITFSSLDFREFFNEHDFQEGDFIYLDPPYLISTATYNENVAGQKMMNKIS